MWPPWGDFSVAGLFSGQKEGEKEGVVAEVQDRLDEILALAGGRRGHFLLESGHHGDLWLELDRLFVRPQVLLPWVNELAGQLAFYQPEAICGPLVGGALLAQMAAAQLGVEFFYTERRVKSEFEGLYPVEYLLPASVRASAAGKRVAVLDDVTNAGSAVRGTVATLTACGAQIVVVGALLVLGRAAPDYFEPRGISVVSLATFTSGLWRPEDCPLCAAGVGLE